MILEGKYFTSPVHVLAHKKGDQMDTNLQSYKNAIIKQQQNMVVKCEAVK